MRAKFGLDSQIVVNCCKIFASYINIPKQEWVKYHEPFKEPVKITTPAKEVQVHTVDHVLPEPYIEKMPFPKVKQRSIVASVVNKSEKKIFEPEDN